jgi:hypothetical protein
MTLGDFLKQAHACAVKSLLKVLADDLAHQMKRADDACTPLEAANAEGAVTYIRYLCKRIGPGVVN